MTGVSGGGTENGIVLCLKLGKFYIGIFELKSLCKACPPF